MESVVAFSELDLPENLQKSLAKMNFQTPTPIQAKSLPFALAGRDIIGCAQTGTGKTGAFTIPMIVRLTLDPEQTALIMTPTRELAMQIFEVVRNMVWFEKKWGGALLIGGASYGPQFQQLRNRPRIVVGTPGRIQDHLDQRTLRLDKTGFLVLDEADRMLDMGFAPQIESIMKMLPSERQTLLFTATLPREIERMTKKFLKDPEKITVGENSKPITKIKQEVIETNEGSKLSHLMTQLTAREGSILIFAKTKIRTERLTNELEDNGHDVVCIHGDRSQRQRSDAIHTFRGGRARILVATDVAARGLDVPHIAHVINFDLPQVPEDYVHRVGRTARAGAEGNALSFVTPSERGMWKRIHRLISGDNRGGFTQEPRSFPSRSVVSSRGDGRREPSQRGLFQSRGHESAASDRPPFRVAPSEANAPRSEVRRDRPEFRPAARPEFRPRAEDRPERTESTADQFKKRRAVNRKFGSLPRQD